MSQFLIGTFIQFLDHSIHIILLMTNRQFLHTESDGDYLPYYPSNEPFPEDDSEFIVYEEDENDYTELPQEQEINPPPPPPSRSRGQRIAPPPVPANHQNAPPPFDPPYPDSQFEPFSTISYAKSYVQRLNNLNEAYIAIPVAFIHRIRDDPRRAPTYGYVIHH